MQPFPHSDSPQRSMKMSTEPIPAPPSMTTEEIASLGRKLYDERHRESLEEKHRGKFVAVDVTTGKAYMAEHSEEALDKAYDGSPEGFFYLIRIGFPAAFSLSSSPLHV